MLQAPHRYTLPVLAPLDIMDDTSQFFSPTQLSSLPDLLMLAGVDGTPTWGKQHTDLSVWWVRHLLALALSEIELWGINGKPSEFSRV